MIDFDYFFVFLDIHLQQHLVLAVFDKKVHLDIRHIGLLLKVNTHLDLITHPQQIHNFCYSGDCGKVIEVD